MEKPFGYIILETAHEDNSISNLEVIDKPRLFYVKFTTTLQSLDCKNRNGRVYSGDALVEGLSDKNLVELMMNNKWKGERDHPITKDIGRIATVWSKEASHRITKWWREGNLIKGNIETLDDGMYGTQLTRNILQGENPSFSLRALAQLEKKGTTTHINTAPRVITYDEVNLPSHKEAYADPQKTTMTTDGKTTKVCENTLGSKTLSTSNTPEFYKNGVIAVYETDIREMITSKSDNLKIVCESFDVDPSTFNFANNGKSLAVKTPDGTAVVGLEDRLAREVINFWKR